MSLLLSRVSESCLPPMFAIIIAIGWVVRDILHSSASLYTIALSSGERVFMSMPFSLQK